MIAAHLAVLQVVLPLTAAPLCLLLRREILAWWMALTAAWIGVVNAALLLDRVMLLGPISYDLGGWAAPLGIVYHVDALNGMVLLLISATAAILLPYARLSVLREVGSERAALFYAALLLCMTGLMGMTATGDAFNVFVFLEISSLSTYALIAMGQDRRALTAAFQYLIMGTLGGTFILIGIGFMYAATGTLNMADLAARLPLAENQRAVQTAFAFFIVGISLKLALFPLHLWLPNAYAYAPPVVTVFLAATATKVAVYVMLRFTFDLFGAHHAFADVTLARVFPVLAGLGIILASLTALYQDHVKRCFAYSSVAQIGYIVLGIALMTPSGLTAGLLHIINHALAKGALFMSLGCLYYRLGAMSMSALAGAAREMPLSAAAFVIAGLSLIGVPLTAGFISKWYLLLASLEHGQWLLALIIVGGSLLALAYVWQVVEQLYFHAPPADRPAVTEAPWSLLIPTWLVVIANLYLGIDSSLTVNLADQAMRALLETQP